MAKKALKQNQVDGSEKGDMLQDSPVRWQLAVLVALGIPLLFAAFSAYPLLTGSTVILEVVPVDPFDMFRGQYMVLSYDVSIVDLAGVQVGDSVHVSLAPDAKGIWRFAGASKNKPGGVFLAGKVVDTQPRAVGRTAVLKDSVRVEYGIEQWFFERNAEFSQQNLTAEVKVASDGRAKIVRLLQNDKPLDIKYQEPGLFS